MSATSSIPQISIVMNEIESEPRQLSTAVTAKPMLSNQSSNNRKHKLLCRTRSVFSSILRTSSSSTTAIINHFHLSNRRSMTHRQKAEIQLEALLSEPEAYWPLAMHEHNDVLPRTEHITIEEVSKILNAQSNTIKRLIRAVNINPENEVAPTLSNVEVQKLIRVLNSTLDRASIGFEEFYEIISQDPSILGSLSKFTILPRCFIDVPVETKQSAFAQRCCSRLCCEQICRQRLRRQFTKDYICNNLSRIIALALYILMNIALSIYVIIYRVVDQKAHVFIVIARVGGILLDFNCALVVALMLKRTMLLIRSNEILRKFIPVDDHIDFHKTVGRVIAVACIIHIIGHMANFARMSESESEPNFTWWEYMFTTSPGIGWVGGFASLSGIILLVIIIIMFIFSMHWIRRSGHFQIFYWTHLLYWLFFVFLIIHADECWKWVIVPWAIFIIEKLYSIITRYSSSSGRSYVESATIEQSNVISLKIHRPRIFRFQPGDYICINLPSVALYEFHPFTISSAPEEANYITMHIQAKGNWTNRVYQYFKDMTYLEQKERQIDIHRADLNLLGTLSQCNKPAENVVFEPSEDVQQVGARRETVIINGPYSSCARYIFDCKHVILIGGGIGITPYASVLSSLMAQFRASRTICKRCQCVNYNNKSLTNNGKLVKVDFIWVNRDHKTFEWFLNLLRQFEEEQEALLADNPEESRFLDIHLFFTQIKYDENLGSVPLDLVTKIWAQVAGKDIFTSLKSKTRLGRPHWDKLFKELNSDENAVTAKDVNVFFCGAPTMGSAIRDQCEKFGFRFFKEDF